MSSNDIYGGKICAALDRQHPRDLFDIKILFDNEGLSAAIRQSFIAYLVSHNRPMHELLSPNLLDIFSTFRNEFQGMSRIYVSHEELISARAQLIMTLRRDLTNKEREFIISFKEGLPKWELMPPSHLKHLPAPQWKLLNIRNMSRIKHAEQLQKLRRVLEV